MTIDDKARYTKTHEWARQDGELITVGISSHAQHSLGDIVFVDLPKPGAAFKAGAVFGAVESVKAASDLYLPVSGTIREANAALASAPETVNRDCYGAGWLVKVEPEAPVEFGGLLSPEEYGAIAASEE